MKRNYNDPAYTEWRKKVLKRDKYRCKMPNCKNKTKLQVHHIKRWANASYLRYEISNGITLCFECHKSIHGKEHHFEHLFRNIIQ